MEDIKGYLKCDPDYLSKYGRSGKITGVRDRKECERLARHAAQMVLARAGLIPCPEPEDRQECRECQSSKGTKT